MSDLVIRGGRLFDPASGLDGAGDLLVHEGRIEAVGAAEGEAEKVIVASGLMVMPGLLDLHVHLREPGEEHKETVSSGTAAAAAGGFAAVACEPNTRPPRDTVERIRELLEIAERDAAVRVLPKCAITAGQQGEAVTDLAGLREAGAVAASDDGLWVKDAEVMKEAFARARAAGMPLTLHVEGPEMVERDIGLAADAEWPVHFSHVSLAEQVEMIARAQQRGLKVTGEATPHHLVLSTDDAVQGDPNFKMNPPLGSARDRAALRVGVATGVISVIASDHAPHATADKRAGYEKALSGVIGLETTIAAVWTDLVQEERLTAERAVRAMTAGPAAVLGIETPALQVGARADVTVFDPKHEWVCDPSHFKSKARNCPFAGRRLRGKVTATIVGGRVVMQEGEVLRPEEVRPQT